MLVICLFSFLFIFEGLYVFAVVRSEGDYSSVSCWVLFSLRSFLRR